MNLVFAFVIGWACCFAALYAWGILLRQQARERLKARKGPNSVENVPETVVAVIRGENKNVVIN